MCGRFTLTRADRAELERELGVPRGSIPDEYQPRYNIAPTDWHFIVRQRFEDREIARAKWGLVNHWAQPGKRVTGPINARAEGVDRRPAFREAFLKRRCVVPADGFFEWVGPGDHRRPLWFHRPDGGLLLLAGLYESWFPAPDRRERTFTILTTRANEMMRPIHDRMPVVLSDEQADAWMNLNEPNPVSLKKLLGPPPDEWLVYRPVSPLLNSPRNDYAELLQPYEFIQ